MHHLAVTIDRGLQQLAGSSELLELDEAEEVLVAELAGVATNLGRVTEQRGAPLGAPRVIAILAIVVAGIVAATVPIGRLRDRPRAAIA